MMFPFLKSWTESFILHCTKCRHRRGPSCSSFSGKPPKPFHKSVDRNNNQWMFRSCRSRQR